MGKIFLSFRQPYNSPVAGRIYDRFIDRLGRDQVVRSDMIDSYGAHGVTSVREAVKQSQVIVILITSYWGDSDNPEGTTLLTSVDDSVRIVIETAIEHRRHILPILINGYGMPSREKLPASIANLADKNALELDTGQRFDDDIRRILDVLAALIKFQIDIDSPRLLATSLRGEAWVPRPVRTGDTVRVNTGSFYLLLLEALILAIGITIFSGFYFQAAAQGCVVGVVALFFFGILLSLPEWRMITSILCALVWALLGYLLGSNIANQVRLVHRNSSLVGLAPFLGAGIVFLLAAAINYSLYRRSSVYKPWIPVSSSEKSD